MFSHYRQFLSPRYISILNEFGEERKLGVGNAFLSEYIPDVSPSFDSRLNFCWEILVRKV